MMLFREKYGRLQSAWSASALRSSCAAARTPVLRAISAFKILSSAIRLAAPHRGRYGRAGRVGVLYAAEDTMRISPSTSHPQASAGE